MKVAIVVDERLDEHKKEMLEAVKDAISKRYEVEVVPFDEDFMKKIRIFDIAFNMATGGGKDSRQLHVPAILDLLGIPYTGSSALTHAICIDKSVTKAVVEKYGVKTPRFFVVHPGDPVPDHDLEYPLIVKPVREGSSKGLRKESVVNDMESLKRAVGWIHENFSEAALVEEFIDGTEVTVGLLETEKGLKVLPLLEIDFSKLPEGIERFYSDRVKNQGLDVYIEYHAPARLPEDVYANVEQSAEKVFNALKMRDYARMDFRIKDGVGYVLDVNSLPLLVPEYSDITKMAKAEGMSYDDLVLSILESAMRRYGLI